MQNGSKVNFEQWGKIGSFSFIRRENGSGSIQLYLGWSKNKNPIKSSPFVISNCKIALEICTILSTYIDEKNKNISSLDDLLEEPSNEENSINNTLGEKSW